MSLDGMSGRSAGSDRTPTIEAKVVILGTQGLLENRKMTETYSSLLTYSTAQHRANCSHGSSNSVYPHFQKDYEGCLFSSL